MSQTIKVEFGKRAVVARLITVTLLYALVRFKGIVTLPILTRVMGLEDYGLFSVIFVTVNLVWPFAALNLHTGCSLYLVHLRQPEEIARSYFSSLHVMLLGGTAGTLLIVTTARWTGLAKAVGPYVALTGLLVLGSIFSQMAATPLTSFQRTRGFFLYNAVTEYGGAALAIGALLLGYGLQGFLAAMSLVSLVTGGFLLYQYTREWGYYPGIDRRLVRKYIRAAVPYLPVSFSQWGLQSLDSYFILYYLGASAVGVNSVAYSLASIILGLLALLNYIYYPTLVAIWGDSRDRFYPIVTRTIRYVALLCGWAIVLFAAASPLLVRLLAAREFGAATPLVPLIVLAFSLHILTQMFQAATLTVNKNTVPLAFAYLAGLAVNAILNPITIPRYGLAGAAWNTVVAYALTHLLVMLFSVRNAPGQIGWGIQLRSVPAVASGWLVTLPLAAPGWSGALVAMAAGTAVYALAAALTGLVTRSDLKQVRMLLAEVRHG